MTTLALISTQQNHNTTQDSPPHKVQYGNYQPKVHQHPSLNFCSKHLTDSPLLSTNGHNFYRTPYFDHPHSSKVFENDPYDFPRPVEFISEEIPNSHFRFNQIKELKRRVHLIPPNESLCFVAKCQKCFEHIRYTGFDCFADITRRWDLWCYPTISYCPNGHFNSGEEYEESSLPTHCQAKAIPSVYFEREASLFYFDYLIEYLKYCEKNPGCHCYWPHVSEKSCQISDKIYDQLEMSFLQHDKKDYMGRFFASRHLACFPYVYYPANWSKHYSVSNCDSGNYLSESELPARLLSHAFFYSQYKQILEDIASKRVLSIQSNSELEEGIIEEFFPFDRKSYNEEDWDAEYEKHREKHRDEIDKIKGRLLENIFSNLENIPSYTKLIQSDFIQLYSHCLKSHPTSKVYQELGLVYFDIGNYELSFENYEKSLELDPENQIAKQKLDEISQIEAQSDWLFKKMAFIEKPKLWKGLDLYKKYALLHMGLIKGGSRSLAATVVGVAETTWSILNWAYSFIYEPVDTSLQTYLEVVQISKSLKQVMSREGKEMLLDACAKHVEKWKNLTLEEKSEVIGYAIGTASLMFAPVSGSPQSLNSLKNLIIIGKGGKNSVISSAKAEEIAILVNQQLKRSEKFIQSTKLQKAKQALHDVSAVDKSMPDAKSIIYLTHTEIETMIPPLMNKGLPINGIGFGKEGFKEIVKLNKMCGEVFDLEKEIWKKTPYAKIHYRLDGSYHIVPYPADGKLDALWRSINEWNNN